MTSLSQSSSQSLSQSYGHYLYQQWTRVADEASPAIRAFFKRRMYNVDLDAVIEVAAKILPPPSRAGRAKHVDLPELLTPMLMWAHLQPWGPSIDTFALQKNWSSVLGSGFSRDTHRKMSNEALQTTFDLFNDLSPSQANTVLDFWLDHANGQMARRNLLDWWSPAANAATDSLVYLHKMANQVPLFHDRPLTVDPPHWNTRLIHWNLAIQRQVLSLSKHDSIRFAQTILSSDLAPQDRIKAFKLSPPVAWVDAGVKALLMPLLPNEPSERLALLPWVGTSEPAEMEKTKTLNQHIAALYCPELAPVLDTMLSDKEWTSVTKLCTVTKAMAEQPSMDMLNLPQDYGLNDIGS